MAKGEADLRPVGGSNLSADDMAGIYKERYGADTAILKTSQADDRKIYAAVLDSVKSFKSGEQSNSLLTNNCGQAGVGILHNAGCTGAPTGPLPDLLKDFISLWLTMLYDGRLTKTEELPSAPQK